MNHEKHPRTYRPIWTFSDFLFQFLRQMTRAALGNKDDSAFAGKFASSPVNHNGTLHSGPGAANENVYIWIVGEKEKE